MIAARKSAANANPPTAPARGPLTAEALLAAARLAENLLLQAARYREYRRTLLLQRQALLRNRIEELEAANEALESQTAQLQDAEEERLSWTRALSEALEGKRSARAYEGWLTRPAETEALPRCEELAARLDSDHATALMAARQELRESLDGLDRDQALNTRLAQNGSRLVHATLAALTHLDGRPGGSRLSTYARNGAGAPTGGQARRLFNRKA